MKKLLLISLIFLVSPALAQGPPTMKGLEDWLDSAPYSETQRQTMIDTMAVIWGYRGEAKEGITKKQFFISKMIEFFENNREKLKVDIKKKAAIEKAEWETEEEFNKIRPIYPLLELSRP